MALVMFEGFNRTNDWDPAIWTLQNLYDGTATYANDYLQFGSETLSFYNSDPFDNNSGIPAASALASFFPQIPTGSTGYGRPTDSVFIGFRLTTPGSLHTGPNGVDVKYWSIWSGTAPSCTIELKGTEYQPDPYVPADGSKFVLRFKQSGTTAAEFEIPNTILPITVFTGTDPVYNNRYGTKFGGTAYLNDGQLYFEFGFDLIANTVTAFVNGTQLLTPAGATSAALTLGVIGGWQFHSPIYANTAYYDDFYVVNSNATDPVTGPGPGGFLGYKTKVLSPTPQTFLERDPFSPGAYPPNWTGYNTPSKLNSDDGDATIISSQTPGAVVDYTFPIAYTNDYIGGVRFKVVARREGAYSVGNIKLRYRYAQYVPGIEEGAVDISDPFLLTAYYQTYRTPFYGSNKFLNLPTGLNWDVFDFNDESGKGFGIQYMP